MKKQVKIEEAKRRAEEQLLIDEMNRRIDEARAYYRRGLIIKYGLIPFSNNVSMNKAKEH